MANAPAEPAVKSAESADQLREVPIPQPKDPAHAFYAVRLSGEEGPTPALPLVIETTVVEDPENPWEDMPRQASNIRELARMEKPRARLIRNAKGKPIMVQAMIWQDANPDYKSRRYSADDRIALAQGRFPRVEEVWLYCPLRDPGPLGSMQDHGVYGGVDGGTVPDDLADKKMAAGICPKCWKDEKERAIKQAKARRKIAEIYSQSGLPLSEALAKAISSEVR